MALFVDDAHDLHPKTLTALKRLIGLVAEGGRQLSIGPSRRRQRWWAWRRSRTRPRTHQMLANLRGSASSPTAPATPSAYYARLEAVPMAA
jgi:hypothetical protein